MLVFGITSFVFGILLIVNPDLVGVLLGLFFLLAGVFTLLGLWRAKQGDKTFSMGKYHIIVKKKNED